MTLDATAVRTAITGSTTDVALCTRGRRRRCLQVAAPARRYCRDTVLLTVEFTSGYDIQDSIAAHVIIPLSDFASRCVTTV